jgi:DNA-binding IclR family transcriptional regulator
MAKDDDVTTRKTTETSLAILDGLSKLEGATLSELAEYVGLATSTVYTHLHTLEEAEYVIELDGEYRLGLKLFHLGEKARSRDDRYRLARQAASELAARVTEEVNFSVEEYGRSIVLFEGSNSAQRGEFQVGRYFYMHSSASGKAMLAEYPEERVREIIDEWGLPGHTDETITDIEELLAELSTVAEQGYAVNRQEEIEGMRAVAVPVMEPDGSVFGTLDISGPSYRLADDEEILSQLRPSVERLETALEQHGG